MRATPTALTCIVAFALGCIAGLSGAFVGTGFHVPKSGNIDFTYLHAILLAPGLAIIGIAVGASFSSKGGRGFSMITGAAAISFTGNLVYHWSLS
jgi:hypothetical protein